MRRWKVHRTTDEISPWAAVYDGWEGNRLALRKSHHGTWAEAMEYADQQARTIEVTLPRLGDDAIRMLSREGLIPYSPAHAETIAKAMLAVERLRR